MDGNNFQDECGWEGFPNEHFSQMPFYRYNNAYGNYRGGYDRSNQGPPLGFGPPGPLMPPPFPMYPNKPWGREFGPNAAFRKQKKDKVTRHLLRCGVPREYVVNLPPDLVHLINPMNCGLCGQSFDSFDMSRIHYVSKNHLKNQKKWVNQRSMSGGTKQSKEPLKARELYCELCDVHITSTGHAESHYAGKSHRAVVEGRKNPRNPFLLQPHMQRRLAALLRRENKFIKKTNPEADKPKPDPKNVPPELYCSICQISMLCSDQMTTHLNGKRHLSKEKQHILKLMKGEVPAEGQKDVSMEAVEDAAGEEDEDDEDEDGDGVEEGVDDADGKADKNGAGDGNVEGDGNEEGDGEKEVAVAAADDDWGSGGEDWKPSAEDY